MLNNVYIRCLLIPISEERQLLLPSTVVAEVFPYHQPESVSGDQSGWLLGRINWREQQIYVLSIEKILSLPTTATLPRHRIVILYGLESNQTLPFYAIMATDVPRTLNVTEETLNNFTAGDRSGIVFNTEINQQESAWIPDLTYLENLLRKYQAQLSSASV